MRLSTSSTADDTACFFDGFIERPHIAAAGLLAVARVARTRYFTASATLATFRDPVFTVEPGGLHAESFSGCCGVHARLDVLPDGLDTRAQTFGTVNVDFNEPMRASLAGLQRHEPLNLSIGDAAVTVSTLDDQAIEQRVPLPARWARGFAEVQAAGANLKPVITLNPRDTRRFLRNLPSGRTGRADVWLQPSPTGLKVLPTAGNNAIWLSGLERLNTLQPLMRHITTITVYGRPDQVGTSVWVADMETMRLILSLSPHRTRGFAGEGGLLYLLANAQLEADCARLEQTLAGSWRWNADNLASNGLSPQRTQHVLLRLGASGHFAWDAPAGEWFRRELPFSAIAGGDPPRLRDARRLVEAGMLTLTDPDHATVTTTNGQRTASLTPPSCTCRWWQKHPGDRGPCKHILALFLSSQAVQTSGQVAPPGVTESSML